LAGTLTATEPLFVPLPGDTLIQAAEALTVHAVFAVTAMFCEPAPAPKLSAAGATVRVGVGGGVLPAACVTFTTTGEPPYVKVMLPERVAPVLAGTSTVTVPSFVPLPGDTVIQVSEEVADHAVFVVTAMFCEPAAALKLSEAGATVRGAVVTVTVTTSLVTEEILFPETELSVWVTIT
jgi:hypothetical protein